MNRPNREGWWSRNWKWFVPVGCLTTLLLFAAGFSLLLSFVFGLMKSSDVYVLALDRARSDRAVIAALGQPIEDGWMASGNISTTGPTGNAELSIPISGPNGSGTIYLEARKSADRWAFRLLEVEVDGRAERIDLLAAPE